MFKDDPQLELFERSEKLSPEQVDRLLGAIMSYYWIIRNTRSTLRHGRAKKRRVYLKIAVIKQRLLLAGADKRALLDYLAHCRMQCKAGCRYCSPWSTRSRNLT